MKFGKGQKLRVFKYKGEYLVMYGSLEIFKLNSKQAKEHGVLLIQKREF